MIVLGIDPGTRRIGYGLIQKEGASLTFVAAGILNIKSSEDAGALQETKSELDSLIKKYKPDAIAIERLFFSKNRKTGIAVAQARGVILLSATENNVPTKEFTPNAIKLALTGYGSADKKSVLKMVRLTLKNFREDVLDDASDALAMAIVCAEERARDIKFS